MNFWEAITFIRQWDAKAHGQVAIRPVMEQPAEELFFFEALPNVRQRATAQMSGQAPSPEGMEVRMLFLWSPRFNTALPAPFPPEPLLTVEWEVVGHPNNPALRGKVIAPMVAGGAA